MMRPEKAPETGIFKDVNRRYNILRAYVLAIAPVESVNTEQQVTSLGTIKRAFRRRSVSTGGTQKQYIVKTERRQYLICREIDGTEEGTSDIYIAKPKLLRNATGSVTFYGRTLNYTPHATDQGRRSMVRTGFAGTYNEYTYPPYYVGAIIYAMECEQDLGLLAAQETGEAATEVITIVDQNLDARRWVKEFETCVDGANTKQLVDISERYT